MTKGDQTIAFLWLGDGSRDPDEITAMTGIAPTDITRAGEITFTRDGFVMRAETNSWTLESRLKGRHGVTADISDILEQLEPHWSAMVEVCREWDAHLSCFVPCHEEEALNLVPEMMERIVALNAFLTVRIYTD